jgi:hypothetical protein
MRILASILFFLAATLVSSAGQTNYFCVVCGKGPLSGRIWLHSRGVVCDDCAQIKDRCSICGLPVRDGDGHTQTDDGRLICRFDKTNAVLSAAEAREIFAGAEHDLIGLFGQGFTLNFPDVAVRTFDVDYWSEKGRTNDLHKFGFSQTRRSGSGQFTHEVVLLSGRLQAEITATSAHEYTHLWINENRPPGREIAQDTVEGICELSAYKLMGERAQAEQQKRILDNPYTHGQIQKLIEVEADKGMGYILDWVKNGTTPTLDETTASFATVKFRAPVSTNLPPPLPAKVKFSGVIAIGGSMQAVINGATFAPGDAKSVKLRDKTVLVECLRVGSTNVTLELDGVATPVTLKVGEEK